MPGRSRSRRHDRATLTTVLPNAWTLYAHFECDSAASYSASYRALITVRTCEEWGATWRHTYPEVIGEATRTVAIDKVPVVAWSFFKAGVPPEWEHPRNQGGLILFLRVDYSEAAALWRTLQVECARGAAPAAVNGVKVTRKGETHVRFDAWLGVEDHGTLQWLQTNVHPKFQTVVARRRSAR